ncbi:unnamed protein product [Boreogadus saida]
MPYYQITAGVLWASAALQTRPIICGGCRQLLKRLSMLSANWADLHHPPTHRIPPPARKRGTSVFLSAATLLLRARPPSVRHVAGSLLGNTMCHLYYAIVPLGMFDIILKFGRHLCLDIASKGIKSLGRIRERRRDIEMMHTRRWQRLGLVEATKTRPCDLISSGSSHCLVQPVSVPSAKCPLNTL